MPDKQQFREYYAGLPDDQFQMVALKADLLPEAREAVTEELQARGLTKADLKAFRRELRRNRVLAKQSEGVARERRWDFEMQVHLVFLVLSGWAGAVLIPMTVTDGRRDWDAVSVLAALLAGSCLLGVWAWKKGKRVLFVLSAVVPLGLLVLSTLVAIVLS
jgi:hypothetical protein